MSTPIRLNITVTAQQENEPNQHVEVAEFTLEGLQEAIDRYPISFSSTFLHTLLRTMLNQALEELGTEINA